MLLISTLTGVDVGASLEDFHWNDYLNKIWIQSIPEVRRFHIPVIKRSGNRALTNATRARFQMDLGVGDIASRGIMIVPNTR